MSQLIIPRSRIIRSDNGGFRVYRPYVRDGRLGTLHYGVPPGLAMCRGCGCTNLWGCNPVCAWADRSGTVCTRCVERLVR
jgi:hypothetical protein